MVVFLFSDLATEIMLGGQWSEVSGFVGLWGLTYAISIVLSHYSSEVYRAKGMPKLSVLAQLLHIVVLWPVVLIAVRYGFETLYVARSLVRLEMIAVNLLLMRLLLRMPVGKMITNVLPCSVAAISMCIILLFPKPDTLFMNFVYVAVCASIYFIVIMMFREERSIVFNFKSLIAKR